MSLSSGTRLGPYEIVALIGAGGMGEVYRARDTRLDRQVAVKVIAPLLAGAEPLRERFEREARSIAALSHPHICTLHDVGRQEGIDFLVMEYLEGETLAARLARAPLSLDETLRITTQLADAMTAAHRAGIVHRDLKPGNVMLTKAGVKVLDFGLARLGAAGPNAASRGESATEPLTGIGGLVGTLPYMAPEQLEGRDVDARTDIFAFGAILYEMATGKRAFSGSSQASLIAAILDREPDPISSVQPVNPPGLERLVRKCLAKDPDARWQSASDIADELRWIASGSGAASGILPGPALPRPTHVGRWVWAAVSGALVIVSLATIGPWLRRAQNVPAPVAARHQQVTFDGNVIGAAIAPDGRTIAYAAGRHGEDVRVFVRDLAGGKNLEIWKGTGVFQLLWLSDGARLVVSALEGSSRRLLLLPRLGGDSRELPYSGAYLSRSPDGSELALASWGAATFRILSLEGEERAQPNVPLRGLSQVEWTFGNRLALAGAGPDRNPGVWTVTREGTDLQQVYASQTRIGGICASPVMDVIYALSSSQDSADLIRLPVRALSAGERKNPEVLLTGLSVFETGFSIANACSVSADGQRLLYRRGVQHANLWQLDLDRPDGSVTQLTRGTATLGLPAVSPDGRWIAAARGTGAAAQVVRVPAGGGEPGEPTVGSSGSNPVWSPDGHLAFSSRRSGQASIWVSGGEGQAPKEIEGSEVGNAHVTWLPDGRLAWPTADARNYRIRDLSTGRGEDLLSDVTQGWLIRVRFSPRGDRIAAFWNRAGKGAGLWVLTWPGREARFLAPGLWPVGWSADGQWIYAHKHGDGVMLRVSPETGKTERAGTFPGVTQEGGCDLPPDRRAMVCALLERSADAWLVEHFDPHIPRR